MTLTLQNLSKGSFIMKKILNKVDFLIGDLELLSQCLTQSSRKPFDDEVCEFLNAVSKKLMKNPASRNYSDVVTFAFWIRKASVDQLKLRLVKKDSNIHLGRGIAFHIAPSNVPCNFAYSLVIGLLTGNINIVRVPSKNFEQIKIITEALMESLRQFVQLEHYIFLIRYDRDKEVNDLLSSVADTRIVWGGDTTIRELRKSELSPRAMEITFADRYSLAIINSQTYLAASVKSKIAEDFYNDTYLTDQNACTSPRIVIWTGEDKDEAKKVFWEHLHHLVAEKYNFQPVQGINKLTEAYLAVINLKDAYIENSYDNLIIRIKLSKIDSHVMNYKGNSGLFFEYDCNDIMEIRNLCNDSRCQTVGYLGKLTDLYPLINSGIKGVDRVVPIGKTMDFDLIWDGYDLMAMLTRVISLT